jgi:hypothetical protein
MIQHAVDAVQDVVDGGSATLFFFLTRGDVGEKEFLGVGSKEKRGKLGRVVRITRIARSTIDCPP